MVDISKLKTAISDSGITVVKLCEKSGIERATLYNRLKGVGEFTVSEMTGICEALRLTESERDDIFLH